MASTALARITETPNVISADALIDKRNGKPKRVPRKVRDAIRLIQSGEVTTVKAAAERVKLSREWLSTSLGLPHTQAFIAQKARSTIGTGMLRASVRLVELIDAKSEHVAAQVSERILTSEGILKSDQGSVSVDVTVKAGFVIDLTDQALTPHMRTVSGNTNDINEVGRHEPKGGPK